MSGYIKTFVGATLRYSRAVIRATATHTFRVPVRVFARGLSHPARGEQ